MFAFFCAASFFANPHSPWGFGIHFSLSCLLFFPCYHTRLASRSSNQSLSTLVRVCRLWVCAQQVGFLSFVFFFGPLPFPPLYPFENRAHPSRCRSRSLLRSFFLRWLPTQPTQNPCFAIGFSFVLFDGFKVRVVFQGRRVPAPFSFRAFPLFSPRPDQPR